MLSRFIMLNIAACVVVFLLGEISLAEPIVDTDENKISSKVNSVLENNLKQIDTVSRTVESKITEDVLEETFRKCETDINKRRDLEVKLSEEGRAIKSSPRKSDLSLLRNRKSDPRARAIESSQLPFEEVSRDVSKRFNLSRDEINRDLPTVPLRGQLATTNRDTCQQMTATRDCDASSCYRTADGQCNNLQNPSWGSAMSCQQRLMNAYYDDGTSEFRTSTNGEPLPAPRTLSLNLHSHLDRPTNYVTHMYMFFGQLLDHDITLTPFSTTIDNEAIECCPTQDDPHPQCAPILLEKNDEFYSQHRVTCLNFVRSLICPTCTLGARQQMNQVTAFIDASFVYGNSLDETNTLRANDGTGRLRFGRGNNGDVLLPSSPDPQNDQCSFPDTDDICFEAGDPRANQHTVLASLQTIFLREHNRLATQLRQINPSWDDERLFQEARRIVGAEMQVITYNEYLPITLSEDRMYYFDLWMGDYTDYDPSENPSMINEFTTAAFRFGHSLINSVVANSPLNASNDQRLLRNEFFQPFELREGIVGPVVRGASYSPAQWFDRHVVPDVTNFLYRIRGNQTGLDLAAININRGRDHGAPPYVEMVRFCSEGRIQVRRFSHLVDRRLMTRENANILQQNYRSVRDVDLWPGILMEIPEDDSVVGPTGACIIGVQFHKLKFGDRFYFEHWNQAGSFTYGQLMELESITLSDIICLNTQDISELPMYAMLFRSRNNPTIYCRNVRGPDLYYWRE